MRVIVAGGTGQVGRRLAPRLVASGHDVIVLSRGPGRQADRVPAGVRVERWDARTPDGWAHLITSDAAIVNLAGENLMAGRWTAALKRDVLDSRVNACRAVAAAIAAAPAKPAALLQASAIGFYGDRGDAELGESSAAGTGWMADVCRQWEAATDDVPVRRVILRIGVVLDPAGGAMTDLTRAARLRVGRLGSGRQWVSWVHHADAAAAIEFLLGRPDVTGPVNVVAPHAVTNAALLAAAAGARGVRPFLPVPRPALRAALGEKAEAVLMSQRVLPRRLLDLGFTFRHPDVGPAILAL
jgi:uncharacterized protein (TIGR01777 family)